MVTFVPVSLIQESSVLQLLRKQRSTQIPIEKPEFIHTIGDKIDDFAVHLPDWDIVVRFFQLHPFFELGTAPEEVGVEYAV